MLYRFLELLRFFAAVFLVAISGSVLSKVETRIRGDFPAHSPLFYHIKKIRKRLNEFYGIFLHMAGFAVDFWLLFFRLLRVEIF